MALLCIALLPISAAAAGLAISPGGGWSYEAGVLRINSNGSYTITMAPGVTTTEDIIKVANGANATITLNNVNIRTRIVTIAFEMGDDAVVTLILTGTNTLEAQRFNALYAGYRSILTIDGAGILELKNDSSSSRIGFDCFESMGDVIIKGGTVTAIASNSIERGRTGIRVGGNFTVEGGTVTAVGGDGNDFNGTGIYVTGDFTVKDGAVSATGGKGASAHFGGSGIDVIGKFTVKDGTVTATGGDNGTVGGVASSSLMTS